MDRVATRKDLYEFVWRALLKHTKEEIVAFHLRYSNPVDWALLHTDLKNLLPMPFLIDLNTLREKMPVWRWDPSMECPQDIFLGLRKIHMEFVLKNDSFPWAV